MTSFHVGYVIDMFNYAKPSCTLCKKEMRKIDEYRIPETVKRLHSYICDTHKVLKFELREGAMVVGEAETTA